MDLISFIIICLIILLISLTGTSISKGMQSTIPYGAIEFQIRNTEVFENESFSLPLNQPFPTNHYEVKTFAIVGAIASGKSTMAFQYYGNRIADIWNEDVNYYVAQDLYASINAIIEGKKRVTYIIIDDSVPLFDSRRSMSGNNIDLTQFYFEIRHELKRAAKLGNGKLGGLVIFCLITQDFKAFDLRIRKALAFTVYKTYDRSVRELKLDAKIIKLLRQMYDKSVRVCDYFYRKLAVGVDIMKKYTLFFAETDNLPAINFKNITGEGLFERQRDHLTNFLVKRINFKTKKDVIKSKLFFELDRMKKYRMKIRISKADFEEIIIRARGILYEKEKQENYLIEFLLKHFKDFNDDYEVLKLKFYSELEVMEEFFDDIYISKDNFNRIRKKAEKEFRNTKIRQINYLVDFLVKELDEKNIEIDGLNESLRSELNNFKFSEKRIYLLEKDLEEIIKSSIENHKSNKEKNEQSNENEKIDCRVNPKWDNMLILYLHDTLGISFKKMEKKYGIPHNTAYRRYCKVLEEKELLAAVLLIDDSED